MTYKKLSAIDDTIDHPTRKSMIFNDMTTKLPFKGPHGSKYINPWDLYGITGESAHRAYLHDPVSAGIVTYMEHGIDALGPMNLHLMLDGIRKQLKRQYGALGADFIELEMNMLLEQILKRKGLKSSLGYHYNPKRTMKQ